MFSRIPSTEPEVVYDPLRNPTSLIVQWDAVEGQGEAEVTLEEVIGGRTGKTRERGACDSTYLPGGAG